MRYLYVYDPTNSTLTEKRDVSTMTDAQVELLKIKLILETRYPLDVLDSDADGVPPDFDQPSSANISRTSRKPSAIHDE